MLQCVTQTPLEQGGDHKREQGLAMGPAQVGTVHLEVVAVAVAAVPPEAAGTAAADHEQRSM